MSSVRERVARWSRLGQNGKDKEMTGTDEMQNIVEVPEHEAAAQVDLEAGTEVHAGEASGDAELHTLRDELASLRDERDSLRERLARLQAEFDNARKREIKERQDARDYAVQGAIEPFLGVMDNFGLALKSEGSVDQLRTGVELIVKQMEEALRGLNVQPVETVGAQFDPHVHEALGSEERADVPDHQVLEEIRRGYKLRDKLLRPALVKIATNAQQVSE
jgi:molecular chaperone GrpE